MQVILFCFLVWISCLAEFAVHVGFKTTLDFLVLGLVVRHASTDGARHLDHVVL